MSKIRPNLNEQHNEHANVLSEGIELKARTENGILDRALSQRTPVKNIRVKKSKDKLTRDEIEYLLFAIKLLNSGCMGKEHKSTTKKLNNQLKELI